MSLALMAGAEIAVYGDGVWGRVCARVVGRVAARRAHAPGDLLEPPFKLAYRHELPAAMVRADRTA
ncbi:MAG: hypothetical protein K0S65_3825 [Labilithrix sp.]|jgi:hypothetical protein|nr:hypothetical protein [Labilithrix sp.]